MNWLIGHLVGDFLLQNDYLAQGKKRSSFICTVHAAIVAICVALFTGWPEWAIVTVLVTHFIQDRWDLIPRYMRLMRQDAFAKPPMAPWSIIVVDQVFHLLTYYLIERMIYGTWV